MSITKSLETAQKNLDTANASTLEATKINTAYATAQNKVVTAQTAYDKLTAAYGDLETKKDEDQ